MKTFNLIGKLALAALIWAAIFSFPSCAYGQYYSSGNGQKLVVDKQLRAISQSTYSDNLESGQYVFSDGEFIDFSIVTKNSGDQAIDSISVVDILPKELELIFSPGTFDRESNQIKWTIDRLGVGESKQNIVRVRVKENSASFYCSSVKRVNRVNVVSGGQNDSDSAFYYVGCKSIPATGDDSLVVKTLVGIVLGCLSLVARRLVRGYWG